MTDPGQLADAEKQAQTIFEQICATSSNRPSSANSVGEMLRNIANWQEQNPALIAIQKAAPEVLLAFLDHSFEWIKAESKPRGNFRVTATLVDATNFCLQAAPKPLPAEMVARSLKNLRESASSRYYFPFENFLSALTPEQITDEMRADLRKLHLQYAPSPTGIIDNRTLKIRNRLAELMKVEGEKQLDPGRGPWSQIVCDELAAKDAITRAGWKALLEHCEKLEQTVPSAKWNKRTHELIAALGDKEVTTTLVRWLALGPTPGQPAEARSPIEDSACQKGAVWCLGLGHDPEAATAIADFGIACLRKIRMMGAVSQKVGFACVQALGTMQCSEAVGQLSRLRAKVKYSVARRLMEKSLRQAAERTGMTIDDLEDSCVDHYGLDGEGKTEINIGDARAAVQLNDEGRVAVAWYNADGKLVKSAPSHIKKAFAKEVKSVSSLIKELEQAYSAQRFRLESSFASPRTMPLAHWRKYFIEHPLLSFLGRRLIWVFRNAQGWEASGLWLDEEAFAVKPHTGNISDSAGKVVDLSAAETVSLWHPLSSEAHELQRWRDRIFNMPVRQPFRQAFREFYQVMDEERKTPMYSNRFAGVVMRQHQLSSLCRARGWDYRLMGTGFDGFNVPSLSLPAWKMHAEFYVDLPSDRDPALKDSALSEQSGAGINLFVGSDQVRFYRDSREIALDEIPAIVYSEVMRDVDLFTSVCAIGDDETWTDQGDRGTGVRGPRFDIQEFSNLVALRAAILTRVLPHTPIADRCRLDKSWLEVRGQLGTYSIQFAWGAVMLATDSGPRWLAIPQNLLDAIPLDLAAIPIDLDHRTEMILRKAHLLADDWKIDDPGLIRQLMPK
ncbi:MAG TPA: DUF4132 domain-containing protein [Candidatus Sulfotelmatobacter sp.]|nr:DUF4132 domain-containing protein [Candidatus Sulfotelmatobacter sp.]